jgi:hypothetical protein
MKLSEHIRAVRAKLYILRHDTRKQFMAQVHEWAHRKAQKIFTRRVLVIVILCLVIQIAARWFHIHLFGQLGELFTAATVEHIFFGVTILEE